MNLVTQQHVDVPFWNDRRIGVVEHVFPADTRRALESFCAELVSATCDEKRLDLEL